MKLSKLVLTAIVAATSMIASADYFNPNNVSVEVVSDYGRELPTFPASRHNNGKLTKTYVEARPGESYAIRVKNHSNERIALVIAVDGRNIISGKRSRLKSRERKYVLAPYQQATYRGWRSSKNRVNEFYFTNEDDSYSAAFGDYSAMGVIAVSVFRDKDRFYYEEHYEDSDRYSDRYRKGSKSAPGASQERSASKYGGDDYDQPGTGYGDERYSRSRSVRFNEEKRAAAKFLIKYEWRETLCEKGITRCYSRSKNRLWRDDWRYSSSRYAPPPPRHYERHWSRK